MRLQGFPRTGWCSVEMEMPMEADLTITEASDLYNNHAEDLRSKLRDTFELAAKRKAAARKRYERQYIKIMDKVEYREALGAVCRLVSCFHQGIIFEGGQEVLLTYSHWKISLRYNLIELQVQGQNLSDLVVEVKEYLDLFYDQLLRKSLSMHSPLPQLEAGFSELVNLLPKRRTKRGLVDVSVHVLRYLFGTLNSSDLEGINSDVIHLYDTSDSMIHNSQEQITILANVQSELFFDWPRPLRPPLDLLSRCLSVTFKIISRHWHE
ncbi:hypothetical protein J6590_048198 [Homalodisca vitripennis]|nr:hypothetical protein J6590_048198 [Homalodisca vitripennis]